MKLTSILLLVLFTLFASEISFSQKKYQFGFKLGSSSEELIRIEQRFDFKSSYLLSISYSFGSKNISGYSNTHQNLLDSTTTTTSQSHSIKFRTLKIDLQRSISTKLFEYNALYYGCFVGVGFQEEQKVINVTSNSIYYPDQIDTPVVGYSKYTMQALRTQIGGTFGLNYRLNNWLILNLEVGMSGLLNSYFDDKSTAFRVYPFISSGLFIAFGPREKSIETPKN